MNPSIRPAAPAPAFVVVPVLDLRGGLAVHARGGVRARYAEVDGVHGRGRDPVALAASLRRATGTDLLYVADLDAIEGRPPQQRLADALAADGARLLLDRGVRAGDEPGLEGLPASVIAGTETLAGPSALRRLAGRVGPDRVVLSLDLRGGRPIVADGADWPDRDDPVAIARAAFDAGLTTLIVLDLAGVGGEGGFGGLGLIGALRADRPGATLLAGGGVAGPDDLRRLRDAGASGALAATALHAGRLDAAGLSAFRGAG